MRNLAMGLVLGLLSAVFVLALPVSIQLPLIGVSLGAAGGAYVGFALAAASTREQLIEWVGVAFFALIGAIGIGITTWALVGGWILHALWDLRHHLGKRSSWVPERYPMFCLAYDLVLAVLAAYLAMEMT